MTELKSRYVCKVCGLGLAWWMGMTFKHLASGGTGKSCGKKAVPMLRSEYEKDLHDAIAQVRQSR